MVSFRPTLPIGENSDQTTQIDLVEFDQSIFGDNMPIGKVLQQPSQMKPAEAHRSKEPDLTAVAITPGSAREIGGVCDIQSPITREILESFLACKTKAYLKLHGHQGI